jgi:hypothetical protein
MGCMPRGRGSAPESPARRAVPIMVAAAFTAALLTAGLACTSSTSNSPYPPKGLQHPIVTVVSVGAAVMGGHHVRIEGFNFASGDKVFFGRKPAQSVEIKPKELIIAVIPPGAGPGEVTVLYKNEGGNACTRVSRKYKCRAVHSADPGGAGQ